MKTAWAMMMEKEDQFVDNKDGEVEEEDEFSSSAMSLFQPFCLGLTPDITTPLFRHHTPALDAFPLIQVVQLSHNSQANQPTHYLFTSPGMYMHPKITAKQTDDFYQNPCTLGKLSVLSISNDDEFLGRPSISGDSIKQFFLTHVLEQGIRPYQLQVQATITERNPIDVILNSVELQ
uniref:Uncharacterized protein n=1 Tax=Branchiostoma floridae TaxID=7739 RepID=C3ZAY6_BRAFL|eukprot:XP_002594012.1 hypothetical protein BRAFLDRAFT_68548 [Branchiostoma floridae]